MINIVRNFTRNSNFTSDLRYNQKKKIPLSTPKKKNFYSDQTNDRRNNSFDIF